MALSTTIAIVGALSAGAQVYSAEKQASSQRKSLRQQKSAQAESQAQATSQQKKAGQAEAKANRKKPNISTLLGQERVRSAQGPGSTMLTGGGGGGKGSLMGGKGSLMGGGGY